MPNDEEFGKALNQLAKTAATKFSDTAKAKAYMLSHIKKNTPLTIWLLTPIANEALNAICQNRRCQIRDNLKNNTFAQARLGNIDLAGIDFDGWYSYPVGSITLAECHQAELLAAAEAEEAIAAGHLRTAEFMRAVAGVIGSKAVKDAIPSNKLAAIWNNVQNKRPRMKSTA
jgi:hypothetical protein